MKGISAMVAGLHGSEIKIKFKKQLELLIRYGSNNLLRGFLCHKWHFQDTHHFQFCDDILLFCFAVIHSGGAALRVKAERLNWCKSMEIDFCFCKYSFSFILVGYFISHRYDGVRFLELARG